MAHLAALSLAAPLLLLLAHGQPIQGLAMHDAPQQPARSQEPGAAGGQWVCQCQRVALEQEQGPGGQEKQEIKWSARLKRDTSRGQVEASGQEQGQEEEERPEQQELKWSARMKRMAPNCTCHFENQG